MEVKAGLGKTALVLYEEPVVLRQFRQWQRPFLGDGGVVSSRGIRVGFQSGGSGEGAVEEGVYVDAYNVCWFAL